MTDSKGLIVVLLILFFLVAFILGGWSLILVSISKITASVREWRDMPNEAFHKHEINPDLEEKSLLVKYQKLSTKDTIQMIFKDWRFYVNSDNYATNRTGTYFCSPKYAANQLRIEANTLGITNIESGSCHKSFTIYLNDININTKHEVLDKLEQMVSSLHLEEIKIYLNSPHESPLIRYNDELGYKITVTYIPNQGYTIKICNKFMMGNMNK